ncbi:hypothetical protein YERSI8AC_180115 [Enterobacterales bacterium 8AC]|nr:hypothetical protein YERSI8AC_180115 [Enterobacterales bacterium 8AC]
MSLSPDLSGLLLLAKDELKKSCLMLVLVLATAEKTDNEVKTTSNGVKIFSMSDIKSEN